MDYRKETLDRLKSKTKISLAIGSKAKDTLRTLRATRNTSGHEHVSDSLAKSSLDDSGSDNSLMSGPSSPAAFHSLRCRGCQRLFNKMRKPEPSKKRYRDSNPSSLSCDVWLLKKTWQPQRLQQARGSLWVHLKRIRQRAANQSDDRMATGAWELCSRPHVFLQRNLRRCKQFFRKAPGNKVKSVQRRRNRAKPRRLLHSEKYPRRQKRSKDTSPHLSTSSDLTFISEDEEPGKGITRREDLPLLEKVSMQQSVRDASALMDIPVIGGGLEGTRRVLKFDSSRDDVLSEEMHKTEHRVVLQHAGRKIHDGQSDFTEKRLDDALSEDLDVFRTPTDQYGTDLRITRKSRPSRPFCVQKNSFRTMLAALKQRHNQIIKESHY